MCKPLVCGISEAMVVAATPVMAHDHPLLDDWPTHDTFADGTDLGISGL